VDISVLRPATAIPTVDISVLTPTTPTTTEEERLCLGQSMGTSVYVSQLVKKFLSFYRTRRFITVFTGNRHWSLSWFSWIQSIPPHLITLKSILILSSHLFLGSIN
jgi:hypothetical protein